MKKEQKTVLVQNVYQSRSNTPTPGTSIEYYLKWRAFIDYINTVGEADPSRQGVSYSSVYGIKDGVGIGINRDSLPQDQVLHTLDEAIKELNIEVTANADNYITLYNDTVADNSDGDYEEITSGQSDYCGQFAHTSELVELDHYGEGTALESECSTVYNGDQYFVTDNASNHSIAWSDWNGCYIDTDDDYSHFGVINSRGYRDWFNTDEYVYCEDNNTYYVNSEVAFDNGVYWSDRRGEYIIEDDEPSIQDCNASYHSGLVRRIIDLDADWKIGFEVEKEDGEAGSIEYQQLYERTHWCKESDGSLNENTGYELISPVYDLFGSSFDVALKDEEIRTLINADQSDACGGHIHVSCPKYTPDQLFEGFSGFYPLLYALYEYRVSKRFCQAKKKHEYYRKDKYSAVYIRDYTVEFRIFSAVKNVDNILWRRDLMRIMASNFNKSEMDVLNMMVNANSKLYKHLRKVIPLDKMMDKVRLFVKYADLYGNKVLPMPTKVPKDNLPSTDSLGA